MSDKEIKENKDIKSDAINDDDVMISTSISDLEKMLESVEEHADKRTDSKFERFFMPSLIVFGLLAFGGFLIIYSITQDMTKLAFFHQNKTNLPTNGFLINAHCIYKILVVYFTADSYR
jgi:hypothetical protein